MALALEGTPVHSNTISGSSANAGPFTTSVATQVFIANTINGSNVTISSITGGGLTWTLRKRSNTGTNTYIELWSAQASSAISAVTFTINYSGSITFSTVDIFAFSGADTSGTPFDTNVSVPSAKDGGPDPILVSTDNANDVVIAAFRTASTSSPTAGATFTAVTNSGADFQLVEYKIVSATQTNLSCGMTTGTGDSNACVVDALKAAAGVGTPQFVISTQLMFGR
jgi:hypothetical protein